MTRALAIAGCVALCALAIAVDAQPQADQFQSAVERCPGAGAFLERLAIRKASAPPVRPVKPSDPALREQIIAMERRDQEIREQVTAGVAPRDVSERIAHVDADNLRVIRATAAAHGFPTSALVGQDGVDAFWLLVQHADSDPQFQAAMLERLLHRPAGETVDASKVALLTDRVLLAQGKLQRYGTQVVFEDSEPRPLPVEDLAGIDSLREQMDLMPLKDYLCVLKRAYGPASARK